MALRRRGYAGGFICIADIDTGTSFEICEVGEVPEDMAFVFAKFAQEKATRLAQHPDHATSAQSKDHDQHKYEGAIRVLGTEFILSFFGLEPQLDEAIVLAVAVMSEMLTENQAREIVSEQGAKLLSALLINVASKERLP